MLDCTGDLCIDTIGIPYGSESPIAVVTTIDHECGAAQHGFHDFDSTHDPKLASDF